MNDALRDKMLDAAREALEDEKDDIISDFAADEKYNLIDLVKEKIGKDYAAKKIIKMIKAYEDSDLAEDLDDDFDEILDDIL